MRLLGRTGKLRGQTHAVSGTTRIGRGPENELLVMVEGVSRRHAQIVSDDTGFWLEDLGSANGTRLNGQPVKRERLEHLDVITLGPGADLIVDARRSDAATLTSKLARPAAIAIEAIDGPQPGSRTEIRPGELSIGRAAPANLILENPAVSKMHARLRRTVNALVIEDFQSANGTFVNAKRVTEPVALNHGDQFSIAGLRTFKVSIVGAPAEAATPAPVAATPAAPAPAAAFDQEWRTKLVWSPEELAAIDAVRTGLGDTGPRPIIPGPDPAAAPPPEPAPRTQHYQSVPAPPPMTPAPAPAPRTQFFESMPEPPPVAPPQGSQPPQGAQPPAAGTQYFESLPLPPPMPPAEPAGGADAPRAAEPAAPRTQHFDSLPLPPPIPGAGHAAPPAPPAAQPPAPRTQFFESLPEPPPAFGAGAPAPPAPKPPAAARSQPPPSEVPTQRFDPVAGVPVTAKAPRPREVRGVRLRGTGQEFVLNEGRHQVGRQETCQVPVLDRQVSRAHAMITVAMGGVTVEDQKSANGTFVNGQRISVVTPLRQGDKVTFGGAEFQVELLDN